MELAKLPWNTSTIDVDDLIIEKAIGFVKSINAGNYVRLTSCEKRDNGEELIFFEIEPEVGQNPPTDIRLSSRRAME